MSIERTVAGDVTVLRLDGDLLGLNAEDRELFAMLASQPRQTR